MCLFNTIEEERNVKNKKENKEKKDKQYKFIFTIQ